MIKFVNFKLLAQLNGLMGQAGLDWRMERIQRGKCLWTHVLIKNMTGDENNARVYVYVNTDENIMYPVPTSMNIFATRSSIRKASQNSLILNTKKSVKRIVTMLDYINWMVLQRLQTVALLMIGLKA